MGYFGENVLTELKNQGVVLSIAEKSAYISACENIQKCKKAEKTKKDIQAGRSYSLWHLPGGDKKTTTHWIVLPGLDSWAVNPAIIVPKIALNIVTGEKQFIKIRRPQGAFYETDHLDVAHREANNNLRLAIPIHYAERNTPLGFKSYIFEPFEGELNLCDLFEKQSTTSRQIVGMMRSAGNALQKIHDSGYLHNDFKLQNVVYDSKKNLVTLIDLESMLSISKGEKGVDQLFGTDGYVSREWLRNSKGKRLIYTVKNDTYAFLSSVDLALGLALSPERLHQEQPDYVNRIKEAHQQIMNWLLRPFNSLPDLKEVMKALSRIEEPEQMLSDKMAGLNLYKRKFRW